MSNQNIALIDADLLDNGTKFPNLALMKISSYYKNKNAAVRLIENYNELTKNNYSNVNNYDKIYISKVFDFTRIDNNLLTFPNVKTGGTGFYFDKAPNLPYEIEHIKPDYDLYNDYIKNDVVNRSKSYYDNYKYSSIGFATRGCFRKCSFCVNQKYDRVMFHSNIQEWLDPKRPRIILLDDNILGYSHWKDVFDELKVTKKSFQFNQGMDIRLLTDEKAKVISECKYYSDVIFAFDNLEDKELIEKKLKLWRQYTNRPTKLYVLAGYDYQDEKAIESIFIRVSILIKYKCLPYLMRHKNYLNNPYKEMFVHLARWINQPRFFKKESFREFCNTCQKQKRKTGYCSAMRAMLQFEKEQPEIANKYFDMKYQGE